MAEHIFKLSPKYWEKRTDPNVALHHGSVTILIPLIGLNVDSHSYYLTTHPSVEPLFNSLQGQEQHWPYRLL